MPDRDPIPWTELLVCPRCRGDLVESTTADPAAGEPVRGLRCDRCRLLYPIIDGVPVMDEALALDV